MIFNDHTDVASLFNAKKGKRDVSVNLFTVKFPKSRDSDDIYKVSRKRKTNYGQQTRVIFLLNR